MLAANGVEGAPQNVATFTKEVLKRPRLSLDRKSIKLRVKKIYESEVRYVNSALIRESHEGFAFRDKNRVMFPNEVHKK